MDGGHGPELAVRAELPELGLPNDLDALRAEGVAKERERERAIRGNDGHRWCSVDRDEHRLGEAIGRGVGVCGRCSRSVVPRVMDHLVLDAFGIQELS
jgi:hypothetical protein